MKVVSETARINSVGGAFHTLPMKELELVNIESAVMVGELQIAMSTERSPKRIRHWPHFYDVTTKDFKDEVLVLI